LIDSGPNLVVTAGVPAAAVAGYLDSSGGA
jgi:hypothetical protein